MDNKMDQQPPPYTTIADVPTQVIGRHEMMPQPHYQQPQHPHVIQQQPGVLPIQFGPQPQSCICPHCRYPVTSRVTSEPNTMTHGMALLLFCCLCWPCAWLPYFMDSCQSQNHTCPNCGAFLGAHNN